MNESPDHLVARGLARWVHIVNSRPRAVVWSVLALTLAFAAYAVPHLGIDSDHTKMVDDDVPSQIAHHEFSQHFPILDEALILVIDGATPEQASEAADALGTALRAMPDHVKQVFEPGGGDFFEHNGLLYQDVDELEELSDYLIRAQPIIAALETDPSIGNLSRLVRMGLDNMPDDAEASRQWGAVLDRVGEATVAVYSEYPVDISWEEVFLRGSSLDTQTRRVLMVDPVLDFDSLLPAGDSLAAVRAAAAELGLTPENGVTVRITGNPALNHEEMIGLAWDIGGAGIFCFLLVALVVYRAMRSLPLAVAAIVTLLVGLVWTAAFAAVAVGHLNLVSICFAVLFIGLGIDFAIHLGTHYAHLRRHGVAHQDALEHAAVNVGSSLVLCSVTTSIGFFAFVPTDYRGVAELGLIAGTGMFFMLFMTLTFFPALLSTWCHFDPATARPARLVLSGRALGWVERHASLVRRVALAGGILGLAMLPAAHFDPDVVKMRDPETESVQAFRDLLNDNDLSSPWFANALAANLDEADTLAERFRALPEVGRVFTLRDFVPADQEDKREILDDLSMILAPPPPADPAPAPPPVETQVQALRDLRDFLAARVHGRPHSPLSRSMAKLRRELTVFLQRVDRESDPGPALEELHTILLGRLPRQLARLHRAFEPDEITLASLPAELASRMVAPDGRARVQVFPSEKLNEPFAVKRFVDAVYTVAERPTGLAVNLVSFAEVTVTALIEALSVAFAAIALLLFALWRRVELVCLALAPLVLGAVLTVAGMVITGISFNFANVIVIPLLLGMGVDSGIHLVHRARIEGLAGKSLTETTTARAVFYSAITTIVSFGTLSFSAHQGMASLGQMLVMGMVLTVVANLVVLPALLVWRQPAERASVEDAAADAVRTGP